MRVVLVEPEIPPNVGNAARLCAATGSSLHVVGPVSFRMDDRALRRAGLDYWPLVNVRVHDGFDAFLASLPAGSPPPLLFSARAPRSYLRAPWAPGGSLVFGKESTGLPAELLCRFADRVRGIPMAGFVRSLNLANAAAVILFEALRALGALEPAGLDAPAAGPPQLSPDPEFG
ncbi:MAG: tRNA (cytidine(34)-2'-O)-methyltransferase [Myxococcota bacterium]|nr:tRNA (cytidine(34)-2'-O)-methyltransferase [Myxococcota bacterium]